MFPNTIIFKFTKGNLQCLLFCLCVVEGDSEDVTEPNCPQTSTQQAREMTFEHVDPGPNQASGNHLWFLPQPRSPTASLPHTRGTALKQLCCSGEQNTGGKGARSQESTCLIGDKVVKLIGAGRGLFIVDGLHIVQLAIRICGEKTRPQQATQ